MGAKVSVQNKLNINNLVEFFLNGANLSLNSVNSANSDNLINH